jgi:hypothetical protein
MYCVGYGIAPGVWGLRNPRRYVDYSGCPYVYVCMRVQCHDARCMCAYVCLLYLCPHPIMISTMEVGHR